MNSMEFLEQIKKYSELYKSWLHLNEQQTKNDLPREITNFLDQNYIVYLESTPEDCEKIRASFHGNRDFENFLFGYTRRATTHLQSKSEEIYLWRGLVSTSLENCGIDYRDTLMYLAELYVTAEEKQLNPSSAFKKVAKISSLKKPRGGSTSVHEIMMNFESYAILTEKRRKK
jgi:hypothetical protein